ncbi:MAG: hypothetical protein ACR2RA_13285 [Geminicoccaceae bacterium]
MVAIGHIPTSLLPANFIAAGCEPWRRLAGGSTGVMVFARSKPGRDPTGRPDIGPAAAHDDLGAAAAQAGGHAQAGNVDHCQSPMGRQDGTGFMVGEVNHFLTFPPYDHHGNQVHAILGIRAPAGMLLAGGTPRIAWTMNENGGWR